MRMGRSFDEDEKKEFLRGCEEGDLTRMERGSFD